MAKDLSQLLTEVRSIIGQTDAASSSISDATLTAWLNDGYRKAVIELRALPITTKDYTPTTGTVTLASTVQTIDIARFNKQPLNEFREMEIMTMEDFIRRFPDYENDDTGIPERIVRKDITTLIVLPAPNSANSGKTLRLFSLVMPTALSASTDLPSALFEPVHDILPHWAAHRAFLFLERADASTQQLILFNQGLKSQRNINQGASRKKGHWRFEEVDA